MSKFSQPNPILSKDYLIEESQAIFALENVYGKADRLQKLFTLMKETQGRLKDMSFSGPQEDANEFLQTLLDIYHDGNHPISLNSKIEPKNQNAGVKNKKPQIDPATTLELEIGSTNKISECLGFYSSTEDIDKSESPKFVLGDGEESKSESGTEKLPSTRTITPILQQNVDEFCLSLKRFTSSNNAIFRINNEISIDEIELDAINEENKAIKQKFTPTAIISHLGNSANSGHYVAFVKELDIKDSEVKWFCYNDNSKTEATKDQIEGIKESCYVVKYSKIHKDGVNLPKSSQNTVGIRNLGNTCWANSTMALFSSMVREKTKVRDFYTSYEHNNSTTQGITPEISVQQASQEDLDKELLALVSKEETSEILEKIESVVRRGANINAENDKHGETALHVAIKRNKKLLIDKLLNLGADINYKNEFVDPPIHFALNKCKQDILLELITEKTNLNLVDKEGNSVLHLAIKYNKLEVAQKIMKMSGVDMTLQNEDGDTVLHLAVSNNWMDIAQDIIKRKEVDIQNKRGNTALHLARAPQPVDPDDANLPRNLNMAELLIQNGINAKIKNNSNDTYFDILFKIVNSYGLYAYQARSLEDLFTAEEIKRQNKGNSLKKEELSHSSSKNKSLSPISSPSVNSPAKTASPTQETEKEVKRIEDFELNFDLKTKKEITPSISIKVTSYEPLMLNEKNIWQQKVAGSEDFISNNRKNNYRVINGVYEENNELSEAKVYEVFKQIIADGAKKYQLSNKEVLQIITHAKTKGGVNNNINIDDGKYLRNVALEPDNMSENAQKNAKSFSSYFQKQCEECGIYSGRTGDNVRSVGLRLTFIPDEIVDGLKLEEKSTAKISEQDFVEENQLEEIKGKVMSLLPQHSR